MAKRSQKIDQKKLNKQFIREVDIRGEKVKIFTVNGTYIRDGLYQDWTQGGHHWVSEDYHFIPDKEIYIDINLNEKDREATILHEMTEYELMKFKDMSYEKAHDKSNKAEKEFREKFKDDFEKYVFLTDTYGIYMFPSQWTSTVKSKYFKKALNILQENKLDTPVKVIEYLYKTAEIDNSGKQKLLKEVGESDFDKYFSNQSEPTPSQEATEHADTFEKIKNGEINSAEELGESIAEDHQKKVKQDLYADVPNWDEVEDKEIKELYSKKTTKSTKDQVLNILQKASLDSNDLEILYNWEGEGSVKEGDSKTGILHEFFTPYWLCKSIADIVKSLGISTGKILDPAMGIGRLTRYIEAKEIVGFEVNKFNYDIVNKIHSYLSNTGKNKSFEISKVYNQAFETAFLQPPRYTKMIIGKNWIGNDFDMVISNPPYGEYSGEYAGFMPKVFTRFETLFIAISMTVVKKGGYGIFILPQSFMNNGNMYNKQKEAILKVCNFVDAVRLPNKIFASTDIGVDVVIFQKK